MTTLFPRNAFTRQTLGAVLLVLLSQGIGVSQTTSELVLPLSQPRTLKWHATARDNAAESTGVDFCLYQNKHADGLTDPNGIQLSEAGPLSYVLLKPTFTLTKKHVKTCELRETPQPSVSDLDYLTLSIEFSDRGKAAMFEAFKNIKPVSFVAVMNGRVFPLRISYEASSAEKTRSKLSLGYFVDREFAQSFADALTPMAGPTPEERSKQLYFPTIAGTRRVMQSTFGEGKIREFAETISKVEEREGSYFVTVQRENPRNEVGYEKRFTTNVYEVSPKGLFTRSTAANGELSSPEPLIKLPARVAEMWTHEQFDQEQGTNRIVNFTVWGQEFIEVPAGRFKTIPVHHQIVWERDGEPVAKWKDTAWYAIGVGVVKHVSDNDGKKSVTELKAFTRESAASAETVE